MGVRPCVTAKLPVLRPWFWNLILLNLAAASCYFIASLGGRVRCQHPFIGRCKMWNCQFVQHLRAAYFETVEQQWSNLLSGPVKQGNKVSLWGHSENRGEDAGVPRAPFKQCWFVREEAEHTRISSYARPQHCQAGVQGEPGRSPQGTIPSWTKTHRTSAEEVLQQTNAFVLIVNHVRSRFGANPCGGAIAKSHGICNVKYAEEVSPKLKLQGYFYRERTSSASFW